uniref:Uncharacterized protein n=1 Tax=Candidatus Methanogaster sp. ANME-2c ERB4 TaxID=2759911 RepID=A0A7G9YEW4_9EURY|nr:hypothetical protein HPDFPBIK_00007 [Methanosarcinales archaeon ANME-2c ERB4]
MTKTNTQAAFIPATSSGVFCRVSIMLGFDRWNVKKPLKLTPILLAVLLLAIMLPAEAALLCSYSGSDPDSEDLYLEDWYLELSDFEVTGPEPLMVGDTVTVSFTLKAIEVPILFGKQGAFVAVNDPDGIDRSFGYTGQDPRLQVGESISVQASTTVDKEGEWIFWPSYHIKVGDVEFPTDRFAPDEWHACYLTVEFAMKVGHQHGSIYLIILNYI